MIQKQCSWCSKLDSRPEFNLYPQSMKKCPRCKEPEHTLVESSVWPKYPGAPEAAKPKPQKTMFAEEA